MKKIMAELKPSSESVGVEKLESLSDRLESLK